MLQTARLHLCVCMFMCECVYVHVCLCEQAEGPYNNRLCKTVPSRPPWVRVEGLMASSISHLCSHHLLEFGDAIGVGCEYGS